MDSGSDLGDDSAVDTVEDSPQAITLDELIAYIYARGRFPEKMELRMPDDRAIVDVVMTAEEIYLSDEKHRGDGSHFLSWLHRRRAGNCRVGRQYPAPTQRPNTHRAPTAGQAYHDGSWYECTLCRGWAADRRPAEGMGE